MRPRLIVNADDFGLTPGINRAVVDLFHAGVLTSATLMATGEAFDEAAEIARRNPGLGVGCHLIFVDGMPVSAPSEIPSLIEAKTDRLRGSLLSFMFAVTRRAVRMEELRLEAEAQIERLLEAGIKVTHLDTHKHVHSMPRVREVIMTVAHKYAVGVRQVYEPPWSIACSKAGWVRRWQTKAIGILGKSPGTTPSGTLGIAATGTLDAETLRAILARLPEASVYELCCHPGYWDQALSRQRTKLMRTRDVEREALLQVVPEFALDLISYAQKSPW